MKSPELILSPDNPEALAAAHQAAAELPFDRELHLFRFKLGASWMYFNKGGAAGPNITIKVEPDSDGSLQKKRESSALHVQKLRERGAPVQNNLIVPKSIGHYVVSITEFLPGSLQNTTDLHKYGAALAKFHLTPIEPTDDLPSFDPLATTRATFKKTLQLQSEGKLPRLGNLIFDDQLVDEFKTMLQQGEEATAKLETVTQQKGQPVSPLHNDITPSNAMVDKKGDVVLIDLERHTTGPWACDLARVVDQWPRFKRHPKMKQSFLKGYESNAPWAMDDEQIQLGVEIAKARYATALMRRVVKMALQGQPQDRYLLGESINRISGEYYWHSEEEYIRTRDTLSE